MTLTDTWLWRALAVWLLTVVPGYSQASAVWRPEQELSRPPASMVVDNASLLNRRPGLSNSISSRLLELRQDFGFCLYLVIQSGLGSDSPVETASTLQKPWVPDGKGIVVVYEIDSKRVGFGRPFLTDPDLTERIASFETVEVITNAVAGIDRTKDDEEIVVQLTELLCNGFRQHFQQAAEPPPAGRSLRLGLFVTGAASALALGSLMVAWLVRRGNDVRTRRYWFTEIDRPERLGAPFGGGAVVSRRFRD